MSESSNQGSNCQFNRQYFNAIDYTFEAQVKKLENGRFDESVASNHIQKNDVVELKVIGAVTRGIWKELRYESASVTVIQSNSIEKA